MGAFDKRKSAHTSQTSFWDLVRQFVEQNVTNGPNPLFLEYYAMY